MLTSRGRPVLRLLKHPHGLLIDDVGDVDDPLRADLVLRLARLKSALDGKRDGSPRNGFLCSVLLSSIDSTGMVTVDWEDAVRGLPPSTNNRGGQVAYPLSPPRGFVEDARAANLLGPVDNTTGAVRWAMPWWSVDTWTIDVLCQEAQMLDEHEPAVWSVHRLDAIVGDLVTLLGDAEHDLSEPTGQVHDPLASIMRVRMSQVAGRVERIIRIWVEHVIALDPGGAARCCDALLHREQSIRLRGDRIDGIVALLDELRVPADGVRPSRAQRLPTPRDRQRFDLCFGLEPTRRLIRLTAGRRVEREEGCLQPMPGSGIPVAKARGTYPAEVRFWHAEDDIVPAVGFASTARQFGAVAYFDPFGKSALPTHEFSSITMGLGYSGSTYGLKVMAKGIFAVDFEGKRDADADGDADDDDAATDELLVWNEEHQAMTDARDVAKRPDVAVLLRVPYTVGGHMAAHFLAAGRTAEGTERVGRILRDCWPALLDSYGERDPRTEGIALIFDVSRPVPRDREDRIQMQTPLAVVFAPGSTPDRSSRNQ